MTLSEPAPVTIDTLRRMKREGERFACLTAYDATFTELLERAGIDVLLVGDSLGMVIQGWESTLPVTLEHMIYHAQAVARARRRALLMVDLPFMAYATPERALDSAVRLMGEGRAHMVKLEGGRTQVAAVRRLSDHGVPVCAHLGLQPQSIHKLGGYRVQGRDPAAAAALLRDARALEEAGADMLLLECVPGDLAAELTGNLDLPVMGIGAGAGCDGQVLVLYDMLGIGGGRPPRFVRNFLTDGRDIFGAVQAYVQAVRKGLFPAPEHTYA